MDEFQEADVLWPDDDHDDDDDDADDKPSKKRPSAQQRAPWKESSPVDIPRARIGGSRSWAPRCTCHDSDTNSEDGDGDDFGNNSGSEMIIPPHIIVAQRSANKMAFSVCIGNGRTLKGRYLRRVRNSILRMTGFLER